ncbi:cyclin-dependent kinase 2-interacting protein isoform X1 [Sinocyclocheilus grahami]|uniref:Cyclin-dependent kinase 2-interacting protein-like n=1 Tax=Sinocyclocheilus grahami TaxID=75366 RepID=A0A672NR86_SINGR|nr:PREDICTED: cyclin-dependent kinase 2-interacting protein-like isoform X1 [Sinocyclocheilus grahami]XP_016101497.1 PREDICTED: cyclin-dependent kinase 2-interacting protein-like isoform X1 [Sinocyclocheilus grahami]
MSESTTPGKKGNLTGSARKLKDDAADWHNLILKWERLNDEGSTIATKIVNLGLSKKSDLEPDVVMEGGRLAAGDISEDMKRSNQELEEECVKLQDVVEKMANMLSKMEKMVHAERGICELEAFQYGETGRAAPLFHTWSTQQFAEVSSKLYESYKQELALKKTILQELAHTANADLSMVYLSSWLYQPYIEDSGKLLLESLLLETGHRPL